MQCNYIDNSVNLLEPILWQYDNAPNLIAFRDLLRDFSREYTTQFWNNFISDVFRLDTANEFGLSVWGVLLGVPRVVDEDGNKISLDVYRNVLKAKLYILGSNCSTAAFNKYISMVFGKSLCQISDGYINEGQYPSSSYVVNTETYVSRIMTMVYNFATDSTLGKDLAAVKDIMSVYPAGVRDNNDHSDILIGLNETESEGQLARNLTDNGVNNDNQGIVKGGI